MQFGLNPDSVGIASDSAANRPNGAASSTLLGRLQLPVSFTNGAIFDRVEQWLEKERDQLPLWAPVAMGTGIASWFLFANPNWWIAFIVICYVIAVLVKLFGSTARVSNALSWFAILAAIGCSLIWLRSWSVSAPVLERPMVVSFYAEIEDVQAVSARDVVRLTLNTEGKQELPPRVRVNVPLDKYAPELQSGAIIKLRARLMPPAMSALPGAYDFSQRAWFMGLGATGQALGDIEIHKAAQSALPMASLRGQLSDHVRSRMPGVAGAIGATLATGDRGAIKEEDAEAMRRSGLAHLLSISGLHVTAVVGAVYLMVLKLLALFPPLANRFRLPLVAAGFAAVAALAYTLLTGAQVPTIRACVAAVLVLVALMMGRSAITLRMVAAGALFVLILWPESLVGPSFQLSFAAVTAIIALHEHPWIKALSLARDEPVSKRIGRFIFSLFLTGLVVEFALMPIALFHFHKAGVYGAFANIIAIPLTTFVIMPLEALALLLDSVGLGAPVWWICGQSLGALSSLAHFVSDQPGAVTMLPTMPKITFALILFGGFWLCLWKTKYRYLGFVPAVAGVLLIGNLRAPDIYITGDGKHVGIRNQNGELAMLRTRSGDFIRNIVLENAGVDGEAMALEDWPGAQCNRDSCTVILSSGNRDWVLLATRSSHYISALALSAACRRADIVVSERWLPRSCQPRWFKADRALLGQVGGMTVDLEKAKVVTVREHTGNHQWMRFRKPKEWKPKKSAKTPPKP